jgi:hypothetical protein
MRGLKTASTGHKINLHSFAPGISFPVAAGFSRPCQGLFSKHPTRKELFFRIFLRSYLIREQALENRYTWCTVSEVCPFSRKCCPIIDHAGGSSP